ncbi:MAG: metal-dependent hydrolase [Bacteroidota bacterium]
MKITYYGHASFGVHLQDTHLLFDPFISPNPLAAHINLTQIPADYILVTHGHGDHVADVQAIAKRTGAKLVSNYEIVSWFGKKGLENSHPLNHGGSVEFGFGRVKYVNAIHSSTMPDGSTGGNPGGFVISSQGGNFYYSGDTALTYDMKLIGEQTKLDVAFLCIGDNFTMGVEDALIAADFIQCDTIIGMHYDTMEVLKINHDAAKDAFAAKGKQLHLLPIGEPITL